MKHGNRKQKGKKFEDLIAGKLHDILYESITEYRELYDLCDNETLKPKRDPSSGTFKISNGDIELGIAKKFFPFSIECKHNKEMNFSLNSILRNKLAMMWTIWDIQACPAAKRQRECPASAPCPDCVLFSGD